MPDSIEQRLQLGAAILKALDNRRERTRDIAQHRGLEEKIIRRELDELEQEWLMTSKRPKADVQVGELHSRE